MNTDNSTKKEDQKGGHPLSTGLGLAVAMGIGATLGILFAPKEGTETQKDLMQKGKELAKNFKKTRKEIQETLQSTFGEVSEMLEKSYLELQGNILAQVDDIKDKAELTREKYDEIVENAVKQFSKGKKWTEKNINALTKELQKDWK